jgi:hypothetical protein
MSASVSAKPNGRMSAFSRTDLQQFVQSLQYRIRLLTETRVHTDRLLATRHNVFVYIEPDENRLSDILRDLLDPTGPHGQRDTFLRRFVAKIPGQSLAVGPCLVFREHITSRIESHLRRIDILVDFGESGLAIENKPWAGDQTDQISDYVSHLERRFAGKFVIVYLTRNEAKPTSLGSGECDRLLREKKLLLWAYPGVLRAWLTNCYKECDAEAVRIFLRNFIEYIDDTFRVTKEDENGD